jgi:hypothetical protein
LSRQEKEIEMDADTTMRARYAPTLTTDWSAAAWSGVIAGAVFMMAEMMLVWLVQGESPWGPPRMMAAMLLGQQVLPPPADFSMSIMAAAMMIHIVLSVIYGLIFGWIAHRLELGGALLAGTVFGLVAVYALNFYVIAPMMFPWFTQARGGISLMTHVLFGVVLGGAYVGLRRAKAHM